MIKFKEVLFVMKFFHVYNEHCFKGLEKNGLINKNTGYKIQHVFSLPENLKFNNLAAKNGHLYNMLKESKAPFYIDRIAGGVTYHQYNFDRALLQEYADLLGEWFLGVQLHESGSNRRASDWHAILRLMDGQKGPYDISVLRERSLSHYAKMPDGTVLSHFSQDPPEVYATMRYAETPEEYMMEMKDMFTRRMADVEGYILPCDSYYLATKLQDDLGMRSFMPEVGWQIPLMRLQVALARGMAEAKKKSWGVYYETWRYTDGEGYTMPCYNNDPVNEWYLTQELHPDDFTSFGHNGGSSRLLQQRIYYYALMSGSQYFSEEWGLNCSYTDMQEFSLSEYGEVKKEFIHTAENFENIHAMIPFAIVLPKAYACVQLPNFDGNYEIGKHNAYYMNCELTAAEKEYYGHIEDVLKLFFSRDGAGEVYGNEGHVITNSRFGDLFDIIYEDAAEEVLEKYACLIDASPDSAFLHAKANTKLRIVESFNLDRLAADVSAIAAESLPCTVDSLHWLLSTAEDGRRFVSVFNNEGNDRSLANGDILLKAAARKVTITFAEPATLKLVKTSTGTIKPEKLNEHTYCVEMPAASFLIAEY